MKNYLLLIIFSILFLLNSCCWYDPWRSEEYINEETKPVYIGIKGHKDLPDEKKYYKFFVNRSFVSVGITAHNRTTTSGDSPYCLVIDVHGKKNIHNLVIIHDIKIQSSLKHMHQPFNENIFPKKLIFEPFPGDEIIWAHFSSGYDLKLDFEKKENIIILLDIEVHTKDKIERKTIQYKFVPHLRKGYIQCVHV